MEQSDFMNLNLESLEAIDWNDPDFEDISSFDLINGPTAGTSLTRTFKEVDVDAFLQQNQNKSTKKKTESDMKVFMQFLLSRNEARFPEFIPPDTLNTYISEFLLSVTKKDGHEYEPTTLRGFISSLDRYLKEKNSKISIIKDTEFEKSRKILKSKMQQLKTLGLGNKPKAAEVLQDEHLQKMYEKNVLGDHDGYSLINSMWLICTTYFGMRTGKETHNLKWGDVRLGLDPQTGSEYIQLNRERQTKTRTGVDPRNIRKLKPKAYAYPENPQRDPVYLYKTYSDKRPDDMNSEDSPFFLTPGSASQNCWYRRTPMGINKLYGIMNDMKEKAGLEDPRITPYSARKRLIQKLNDEGVPPNQIIQISGHKNVNSLNNYSKLNSEQSRRISDILSNKPSNVLVPSTVTPPTATSMKPSQFPESTPLPQGFFANSHFHGNVTFNFNSRNETQNLSQLTQQVMRPQHDPANVINNVNEQRQRVPSPLQPPAPMDTVSPIQSPFVPPARKYRRIRIYPESDSD